MTVQQKSQPGKRNPKREPFSALSAPTPTPAALRSAVAPLSAPFTIEPKEQTTATVHVPASKLPEPPWPEVEKQYQAECAKDVTSFLVRLHRMRIRLAGQLLAGQYPDDKDSPMSRLCEASSGGDSPLAVSRTRRAAAILNRTLPESCRVSVDLIHSREDLESLYEFVSNLQYRKPSSPACIAGLQGCLNHTNCLFREVAELSYQGDLFAPSAMCGRTELVLERAWNRYREILKGAAHFEALDSYYTPTYGSSSDGRHASNQRSEPFSTDYQRVHMEERQRLQGTLKTRHFRKTAYEEYTDTIAFNNGLQAFDAVFKFLDREQGWSKSSRRRAPILKTRDIYFEADQLIEDYCQTRSIKLIEYPASDMRGLIDGVLKQRPRAIFVNPLSNMFEMPVCDVGLLIDALRTSEVAKLYRERREIGNPQLLLVIDNSVASRLARWGERDFTRLPPYLQIVSIESLVKYGQDGQDLTQAALATTIGQFVRSALYKPSQAAGFNISEHTVRTLEHATSADLIDERLKRHSRNALTIAKALEDRCGATSIFDRVYYPGLASHPSADTARKGLLGGGPLLNISLNIPALLRYREIDSPQFHYCPWQFDSKKNWLEMVAKSFQALVLERARAIGLTIHAGSGYGFNETRVAVYNRKSKEGPGDTYPYIRVAAGIENIHKCLLVTQVLLRAQEIFDDALKQGCLDRLAQSIEK